MTYLPSASKAFAEFSEVASPANLPARIETKPARAPRRGFWKTILDSLWASRQRQADIEIARYIAMSGGKMTDGMEREISRRLSGQDNYRPF
jgi:hypothetical protein